VSIVRAPLKFPASPPSVLWGAADQFIEQGAIFDGAWRANVATNPLEARMRLVHAQNIASGFAEGRGVGGAQASPEAIVVLALTRSAETEQHRQR
jgi:hypothetical protein